MITIEGRNQVYWTDEQTAELRRLIEVEAVSFSIAAARLGAMFPELKGITRNALIGRAHRCGITSNSKFGGKTYIRGKTKKRIDKQKREQARQETPRAKVERTLTDIAEGRALMKRLMAETFEWDEPVSSVVRIHAEPLPETPDTGIPASETGFSLIDAFNERQAGQCKWPYGDVHEGTFRYCCKPVQTHIRGLPYCHAHQVIAAHDKRKPHVRREQMRQSGLLEAAE